MHFFITVLINPEETLVDINSAHKYVDAALAPFSEHDEVPEYDRKCWCVGNVARKAAEAEADAKCGSFEEKRTKYWQIPEAERPEWSEFMGDWFAARKEAFEKHPLKDAGSKECDCEGTGYYKTTYNPNSKWDWYQIGGRWTGYWGNYDPEKDPDNIETCWLCQGTGTRTDMKVNNGCNGCQGTGKAVRWPTQWKTYAGDILRAHNLRRRLMNSTEIGPSYAILTPDGEWLEKPEDRLYTPTTKEEAQAWKQKYLDTLDRYHDSYAVIVDCHI